MRKHRLTSLALCGALLLISYGCADKKMRIISSDIPLNVYDLEEIRAGVDEHKTFSQTYKFITDETVNQYVSEIGKKIAQVSERPFLPWQFRVVDSPDKYEAFAFPGGHIYISSGLFAFVESEAELAAVLAHEVGHTSAFRYQHREESKKLKWGRAAKFGAGAAGGFLGPAGSAASSVISGIEVSSPYLKQQFSKSAEAEADGRAMNYLNKLGYPPEAVVAYNKRLASIPIDRLPGFVHFFNAHPPSEHRVENAKESLAQIRVSAPSEGGFDWGTERHAEMARILFPERSSEEKKSLIDIVLDASGATRDGGASKSAGAASSTQ